MSSRYIFPNIADRFHHHERSLPRCSTFNGEKAAQQPNQWIMRQHHAGWPTRGHSPYTLQCWCTWAQSWTRRWSIACSTRHRWDEWCRRGTHRRTASSPCCRTWPSLRHMCTWHLRCMPLWQDRSIVCECLRWWSGYRSHWSLWWESGSPSCRFWRKDRRYLSDGITEIFVLLFYYMFYYSKCCCYLYILLFKVRVRDRK